MKISIFVPSNRSTLAACARLLDCCALASDDVEVVIRDNSGDAAKQDFLNSLRPRLHPNCKIESVPPCVAWENGFKTLELTTGDYIFGGSDDDIINPMAMADICKAIELHGNESGVIGVTGHFLVENENNSQIVSFPELSEPATLLRAGTYLRANRRNVVQFSPVRREPYFRLINFIRSLPFQGSYTDQTYNVLMVAMGRLVTIDRVIYQYDTSNWWTYKSALREDTKYYLYAGIDSSAVRLHWLFGSFEGASCLHSKFDGLSHLSQAERTELAMTWFIIARERFIRSPSRPGVDEKFGEEAEKIAVKWRQMSQINFGELLTDLASFISLSNPQLAERYIAFWK